RRVRVRVQGPRAAHRHPGRHQGRRRTVLVGTGTVHPQPRPSPRPPPRRTDPARQHREQRMSTTIGTKLTAPGFHRWPDATSDRSYLAHRHRHLFHLSAEVAVHHDDRDIEFHNLQAAIREWWGPGERELGHASCETLARQLAAHLEQALGCTVTTVTVSEHGESWATYTPNPKDRPCTHRSPRPSR